MKKIFLLLAAATMLTNVADAQKTKKADKTPKVFVRVGLGYALATATTALATQTSTTEVITKYSNGAGLNLKAAIGYQALPNVAFELGIHYGLVPKKGTESYSSTTDYVLYSYKGKNPLYLIPSVVICTNTEPFDVYTRVGVVLPVLGRTEVTATETYNTTVSESKSVIKSGFNVGFQGALGVKYTITRRFKLWAEVEGITLSRWAKSAEVKSYTINGVDKLSALNTHSKKTNYVFSYDNSTTTTSTDVPATNTTFSIPYSSIGLNVGVSIGL